VIKNENIYQRKIRSWVKLLTQYGKVNNGEAIINVPSTILYLSKCEVRKYPTANNSLLDKNINFDVSKQI